MDLKNIISKKAHESSVKRLSDVPPTIKKYLTEEFLTSIASSLSAITRDHFNYTGKIVQQNEKLNIFFTTSTRTDTIEMIISYENSGFEFRNINQKLEKSLDALPQEVKPVSVKKKQPNPVKVVVKKEEPQEPPVKLSLDMLTKVIDAGKKEEADQITFSMMKALQSLTIKDDIEKKIDLLSKLT